MKGKIRFSYTVGICTLHFWAVTALCSAHGMGELDLDLAIATTALHEWMPSVTYNPVENEFLVLWHTTGVREAGGENMYSLHAQRISPDGKLLGDPFSLIPSAGPGRRILPRAAYNSYSNQYMVVFCMEQAVTGWDPFITIIEHDGTMLFGPQAISEQPTNANHASIAFNSVRRQYLVAYNDSRNGEHDIFGVILDEQGNVVREDFAICTAEGEQQNPFIYYNAKDDTYLLNWEDFRHVSTWTEPGDIFGILLDGTGNIIAEDIPMVNDYGKEDEGGQWLNNIAYNPDKNEFLVSWMDTRLSMEDAGIVGRIINSDGVPEEPDFVLVDDAPGAQFWHQTLYLQEQKRYFAVWQDNRNDPDTELMQTSNSDIYAKWLSPSGRPLEPEFPISTAAHNQKYPVVAYSPVMDRLLIVWRDELEEEVSGGAGSGHVTEAGGNIMGKIYGVPAFLSGRVVDQETEAPVESARVLVIGPAFPAIKSTNVGGWFNIVKGMQISSTYFIIVLKQDYQTAVQSVTYLGEPLQVTVGLSKLAEK